MKFTATCPRGLEDLLLAELKALDLDVTSQTRAAVLFESDIAGAMRACLWSRIANRVLHPLASFAAEDPDQLYRGASAIDWSTHFDNDKTFAIDASTAATAGITHSQFAGLRVKDAIADHFREETGARPDVDTEAPDIRVNVHVYKSQATISLDLSGHSLHKRGYRARMVDAPLKENVAAAMLMRMRWPAIAAEGGSFVDPFCGSGTLLIEAAMIAADIAPGLLSESWGFFGWSRFKADTWNAIVEEALDRTDAGLDNIPLISGSDNNPEAVAATKANIRAAGLSWKVLVEEGDATTIKPPEDSTPGLVLSNPPYGERLSSTPELTPLYMNLGQNLSQQFAGWQLGILTADSGLARATGLRANKHWAIDNGPIACRLYRIAVSEGSGTAAAPPELVNRLKKNLKHLQRWAKREQMENYRIYDADIPEYASAIDIYQTHGQVDGVENPLYAIIQEYAAPASVPPAKAEQRLRQTLVATCEVLGIPPQQARLKTRERQRGKGQYKKQSDNQTLHTVIEHGPAASVKLFVNFDDYLDTGLFLDHAPIRRQLQTECHGKNLLNLFCYTSSVSVHAAAGGAKSTTSVDMSKTYLEWSERNLTVNGLSSKTNHLVRADVTQWLREAAEMPQRYEVIFCDPPSFSNSKRMDDDFDIQRDHAELITNSMALLSKGGKLIFSCNRKGFKLDSGVTDNFVVNDTTPQTIGEDFKAKTGKPIHVCFEITAKS